MNVGDKVLFWLDTRPLLDSHAMKAEVTEVLDGGERARVTVQNPSRWTMVDGKPVASTFSVVADMSERAAPGVVTADGVTAHSQHEPDDRIAADAPAPAAAPEQVSRTRAPRGSSGGSAAPAADGA
jgi:hypothetical protein